MDTSVVPILGCVMILYVTQRSAVHLQGTQTPSMRMQRRMQRLQDERIHLEGVVAFERNLLAQQQADNIALRQQLQQQQAVVMQFQSLLGDRQPIDDQLHRNSHTGCIMAQHGAHESVSLHEHYTAHLQMGDRPNLQKQQRERTGAEAAAQVQTPRAPMMWQQTHGGDSGRGHRLAESASTAQLHSEQNRLQATLHADSSQQSGSAHADPAIRQCDDQSVTEGFSGKGQHALEWGNRQSWGLGNAFIAELDSELEVVRSELEAVKEQLKTAQAQVYGTVYGDVQCWLMHSGAIQLSCVSIRTQHQHPTAHGLELDIYQSNLQTMVTSAEDSWGHSYSVCHFHDTAFDTAPGNSDQILSKVFSVAGSNNKWSK